MAFPIQTIRPAADIPGLDALTGAKPGGAPGGAGAFQSALAEAVGNVQQAEQSSQASVDRFLSGENEEVHTVALETQRAELTFEMFMQVRNKVVQAYQEVMRMQM